MSHPATTILPHPELLSTLSKRDAAALRKFSDASQARAWTRRTVARYQKYISTLLAIHNSIAPINKLPTEILQMVFACIPSEYETWCDASWMVSLQSVCRRWRSVLLATPEYWVGGIRHVINLCPDALDSDADEEDEGWDLLDLFLARSAPCPFELKNVSVGWQVFQNHFDRVTVFEVAAQDGEDELDDILHTVATKMKRLERFELCEPCFETSMEGLDQWEAQNLPRLGCLIIPSTLFCCATTVPSLHTVILTGDRDIESLPDLFDALERCPALATLCLNLTSNRHNSNQGRTLERIVDLHKLRQLDVTGTTSDIYCFLSSVSFPLVTLVGLGVINVSDGQFVLPNTLPRRHSGLYASPNIDRLCLHPGGQRWYDSDRTCVSMRGYVQGEERLRVSPALSLHSADHLLQFLDAFSACMLTELALNLRHHTSYTDRPFWERFFAALPDLRRLELLSATVESRAMTRAIAEQFLAASRAPQQARRGTSLAWVLHAETSDTSRLEEGLRDVEQVLSGHADSGGRLERLELYVTTSEPYSYGPEPVDVTQIATDGAASRLVTRAYVSRLEDAADVVFVGGGWGLRRTTSAT